MFPANRLIPTLCLHSPTLTPRARPTWLMSPPRPQRIALPSPAVASRCSLQHSPLSKRVPPRRATYSASRASQASWPPKKPAISFLYLTRVAIEFHAADLYEQGATGIYCAATVETVGPTGVEMEALMAVQVALLTIYDMCKAVDRGMSILGVRVLEKHGGKSGDYASETYFNSTDN